jgi:hypothetical protein
MDQRRCLHVSRCQGGGSSTGTPASAACLIQSCAALMPAVLTSYYPCVAWLDPTTPATSTIRVWSFFYSPTEATALLQRFQCAQNGTRTATSTFVRTRAVTAPHHRRHCRRLFTLCKKPANFASTTVNLSCAGERPGSLARLVAVQWPGPAGLCRLAVGRSNGQAKCRWSPIFVLFVLPSL